MSRSSHDEGELSDESHKRRHQSVSDEDGSQKESEIRAKLLNKMHKRKHSESEGEDDDVRFTIQPKSAKNREREREKRKRVEPPSPDQSRHHRERKHDREKHRRHSRERSRERERKHHRRNSTDEESSKKSKTSQKDKEKQEQNMKLFDRVFDPKPKKPTDEVIEIQDVEMSPVEILDDEKPISTFTLEAEAGPKKYSKFESDDDQTPVGSPIGSDVEMIEDEDEKHEYEKSSDKEEEEEEELDSNIKWQDLTAEQKEMLAPDTKKRLEDAYQKELIGKLPVFYPGIMGCRNIAEYECVNKVDEGTFGVVYRGKDKRTDEIVALKRLKMEKEKEGFPITALREIIMLLKAGSHPNIVNVKEILIGTNMDKIYMAMEFVEHDLKSLIDTMKKWNKRFSTGEQKTLLHQLLSGIDHMHKLWILHRDLKTSNLLMSHKGVLKIADFGLAREYGNPSKKFTSVVVTLWYRSPELLLGTKYYSTPVDMWSIGCIMSEFILLKPLFPGRGELEQIKKIFMELGTPTEKIWPDVVELDGSKKLSFENYPYNQLRKQFLSGRLLDDMGLKFTEMLLEKIRKMPKIKNNTFIINMIQQVDGVACEAIDLCGLSDSDKQTLFNQLPETPTRGFFQSELVKDDDGFEADINLGLIDAILDNFSPSTNIVVNFEIDYFDKLSVLKVTQTKTFDEVGHPIPGGLYDSVLGPGDKHDKCLTCNQYDRHCPGHMGHIQLTVPVFNPLLYQFTYNLLKGTCVHCHRFTCKSDGVDAKVLLAQLRCFELGVEHVALDLEHVLKQLIDNDDVSDEKDELADLDNHIAKLACKPIEELRMYQASPTKNSVQLKNGIIREFLRSKLFKRITKCPFCKNRNGTLRNDRARCILIDFSGKSRKSKNPKVIIGEMGMDEVDSEEEEDEDDLKKKNAAVTSDFTTGSLEMQMSNVRRGDCDKLAWRGAEVREHFRMVFKNDGNLLMKLFPMLVDELEGGSTICPLDGLFLERVLVPPKKFRPIRMFKGAQYEDQRLP